MDIVQNWAVSELTKLLQGVEESDLRQMVRSHDELDTASINQDLSGLLDITQKDVKTFINTYCAKIDKQREYDLKASQLKSKTDKQQREKTKNKLSRPPRDFSKVNPKRVQCYCQATKHRLINNCTNCGKIICELEGEGPCLFCGTWVDRDQSYDIQELQEYHSLEYARQYEVALQHRDRLLEYDENAARRLGVIDEQQDWYSLSSNTWLNSEQRNYAAQMLEVEKKRQSEIDSKMSVDINLQTGEVKLHMDKQDDAFEIGQQIKDSNMFMSKQFQKDNGAYEKDPELMMKECEKALKSLGQFTIVSAPLTNDKDKDLYNKLSGQKDFQQDKKKKGKGKVEEQVDPGFTALKPQGGGGPKGSQPEMTAQQMGFFSRLQTENPFDEFKEAVEKAMLEKAGKQKKVFKGDTDLFKEADDTGMCLSMHQPWASLMVMGIKRFEGREWTTKYRGPLWIHSTSTKPDQQLIDQIEDQYRRQYAEIGEDMPAFPDRYLLSGVVGRVDLIDVLSHEEYLDTVPKCLQEETSASYLMVIRNPQYLDIPLRMAGQPNIYKMPKEISFGARPLLKKAPYTWWPPKKYQNYTIGQFDIYPQSFKEEAVRMMLSGQFKSNLNKPTVEKLDNGIFILRDVIPLQVQQTVLNQIRDQCVGMPHIYKFSKLQPPSELELDRAETQGVLRPYVQKLSCYQMEILKNDVAEAMRLSLPSLVEECLKETHLKGHFKRYRMDFYKPDGSCDQNEQVLLKPDKRGKKPQVQYMAICFGDKCEVQADVTEGGQEWTLTKNLASGDALVVDQTIKEMKIGVKKVQQGTKPECLVLREGSLLTHFELI